MKPITILAALDQCLKKIEHQKQYQCQKRININNIMNQFLLIIQSR